jgi:plastocyanin
MKHAISGLALAASVSIATAAAATEHNVLILPDAYFPQVTYIEPGDTVKFTNVSGSNQSIVAKNNNWVLGPIAPDGQMTIVMDTGVQTTFYNADATDSDGEYVVEGRLSFSAAPLN